jgi:hypothetical protein
MFEDDMQDAEIEALAADGDKPPMSAALRAAWQWSCWKARRKNQAAVLNPITHLRERVKLK